MQCELTGAALFGTPHARIALAMLGGCRTINPQIMVALSLGATYKKKLAVA